MILGTLNNKELAAWCEDWARRHTPEGGNIQKVILALCERLKTPALQDSPSNIVHRDGPTT